MRPIVIGLCLIRFEGDLLHIESPPMPHPNLAGKVVRVIVTWQRDR